MNKYKVHYPPKDIIKADTIGIRRLSSKLDFGTSSTIVEAIIAMIEKVKSISGTKNITMTKDVNKKARLPSSVLSKIFVLPYFLPIMAAAESEKLMISKAGMHILLSKIDRTIKAPIIT